jgi:hypothetical protein
MRFPRSDGSFGNENTITVVNVGSPAHEAMIAERERQARMATVRRRWRYFA